MTKPLLNRQPAPLCQSPDGAPRPPVLELTRLSVFAASGPILQNLSLAVGERQIFGIVGPSGVGKSTLLRALNRLLDLQTNYRVEGSVRLRGQEIYSHDRNPDELRTRIGMLFQQPVVFPGSIETNVLFGLRHHRSLRRSEKAELLEKFLRRAALWSEVKDRLRDSAQRLSLGQQQRLCLARTLAVDPEIILMDEPTSALDARSTRAIEDLMLEIKRDRSIVLVTHDLAQARRVTDWVACLCLKDGSGQLLESACCDAFFSSEACRRAFAGLEES